MESPETKTKEAPGIFKESRPFANYWSIQFWSGVEELIIFDS